MSAPQITAVPLEGVRKPVIIFMVVDLPAPLGPRKPSTSPRSTLKDTSSTAMIGPKRRVKARTSIIVSMSSRSQRAMCQISAAEIKPVCVSALLNSL